MGELRGDGRCGLEPAWARDRLPRRIPPEAGGGGEMQRKKRGVTNLRPNQAKLICIACTGEARGCCQPSQPASQPSHRHAGVERALPEPVGANHNAHNPFTSTRGAADVRQAPSIACRRRRSTREREEKPTKSSLPWNARCIPRRSRSTPSNRTAKSSAARLPTTFCGIGRGVCTRP